MVASMSGCVAPTGHHRFLDATPPESLDVVACQSPMSALNPSMNASYRMGRMSLGDVAAGLAQRLVPQLGVLDQTSRRPVASGGGMWCRADKCRSACSHPGRSVAFGSHVLYGRAPGRHSLWRIPTRTWGRGRQDHGLGHCGGRRPHRAHGIGVGVRVRWHRPGCAITARKNRQERYSVARAGGTSAG
jgi:hypothetical protein